jgi:FdrA protein
MQLQRALAELPGVVDAGVVMATPANQELLAASALWPENISGEKPKADDLLIVVKAEDETAAVNALSQVDALLQRRRATMAQDFRPRSVAAAVKALPEAAWVLVSVPGRYAAGVAREALQLGKHVFLYSDNVAPADEVLLKQTARDKGLLVMGPDCGTAIINGVGLGFANRVRRGDIGLVGAAGTGLQAVTSHIHHLGGGVSQAIGTGGRDLRADIGAITTHQAVELLGRDTETKVIVLVSKPPAPEVATRLLAAAQATGKPVVVDFIGYPPPARQLGNLHFAATLSEAAELAVEIGQRQSEMEANPPLSAFLSPLTGYMRGLFAGGTLAYEALLGLQAVVTPIYSNVPIREEQRLRDPLISQGHTILDLGEDFFTQGRLHPMIDNDLRLRRLRQEAAESKVALVLLDVVLGEGAHPDPASELAPAIASVKAEAAKEARDLEIVVIVVGTDEDPQALASQVERLAQAGATICRSMTEAVRYVALYLSQPYSGAALPVSLDQFRGPLAAVNVGLESFYESLKTQGAQAIQVAWRPPAGGNEKLMTILARMKNQG